MHSIPYTAANFQVKEERDHIMSKVFEALQAADVNIRENAMQCLVLIATQEYE